MGMVQRSLEETDDQELIEQLKTSISQRIESKVRDLNDEAICLRSDMDAALGRLRWDGIKADVADIKTGNWYRLTTEVQVLQKILYKIEESFQETEAVSFLRGELSGEILSRMNLLREEASSLKESMESALGGFQWKRFTSNVPNIKTGAWYKLVTELQILQEILDKLPRRASWSEDTLS